MNNTIWLYIALGVWVAYNLPIVIIYGIQSSVSSTYNLFEDIWRRSLMSWFIAGVAIPMTIVADNILGFLSALFLLLVFVAPTVRKSTFDRYLHVIGADMGLAFGMASLLFINWHWWWLILTFAVFTIASMRNGYKNHTYWIETIGFVIIWVGLFIEKT